MNPSLLERSTKNLISASTNKFTFDPTGSKRPLPVTHETEFRKLAQVDVLQKARDFGIKLWHLEKLHRVLATILEDGQPSHGHNTRSTGGSATAQPRTNKHNDLTQMMKNEQLHERGERAFSLANAELVELKGPFIYVRDINEKCKPIMVREYEKVQVKEDGEWPQFRSAGIGKCPFVEEDPQSRRQDEEERHREKERASLAKAKVQERAARTRASTKVSEEHMRPPAKAERREPLAESISAGNSGGALSHQLPPPPAASASTFTKPIDSSNVKAAMLGPRLGFVRGEPMASGMQQSSITSAIRSQMISSTAAAPGAKAGTSKEVHGLQRKILERNNGPMALIQSQRMMDIAGTAARAGGTMPRAAKQRAQEKLGYKPEPVPAQVADEESEEEEEVQIVKEAKRTTICRTGTKKEPKPGYCENCKEKFDDFDTVSAILSPIDLALILFLSTPKTASTGALPPINRTGKSSMISSLCLFVLCKERPLLLQIARCPWSCSIPNNSRQQKFCMRIPIYLAFSSLLASRCSGRFHHCKSDGSLHCFLGGQIPLRGSFI